LLLQIFITCHVKLDHEWLTYVANAVKTAITKKGEMVLRMRSEIYTFLESWYGFLASSGLFRIVHLVGLNLRARCSAVKRFNSMDDFSAIEQPLVDDNHDRPAQD